MTMTEGTAPTPPSALPVDLTPSHSVYGFETDTWVEQPIPEAPDWFSRQERYRRNANEQAYRQYGHPTNWNRYVHLGLFVFEDCFECDKVWAAVKTDPLMVHRAIWYNFMSHLDRDLQVSAQLNEWATNISQPYLAFHDPTTLHETDTIAFSWKEMSFFKQQDEMEIDEVQAWIPVSGRRRSKSPPNQQPITNGNTSNVVGSFAPGFNLPPEELPRNYRPMEKKPPDQRGNLPPNQKINEVIESKADPVEQLNKTMRDQKKLDSKKITTDRKVIDKAVQQETRNSTDNNRYDPNENDSTTPRSNTNNQTAPHPNIPTNDGTHRITIKWFPSDDLAGYESDKNKMNEAIYNLVSDILPHQYGMLYRWESEDLTMSNSVHNLTAIELRDYISPKVTMVSERSQMIFGIRFGFKNNPSMWKNSANMKEKLQTKQLDVTISNSASSSGKMVTAGYILLKAPNTTHKLWYNKYLRSLLPDNAPFFDVVRQKKSPMDQLIPHLTIQCGEKHVTPLCQALLQIMTGRGIALFLPRYALGTMSNEQVRKHFQFHDRWAKSLTAITLSPQVTHLDQVRTEYHEDGSTTQRSTREWIASLKEKDETTSALCDAVNGTNDNKAYLVTPSHYLQRAQYQWQQYKSRLFPPSHREARFRDNLPGLPDVIVIQTEIQANVKFLEQMSMTPTWYQELEGQASLDSTSLRTNSNHHTSQTVSQKHHNAHPQRTNQAWPTPSEASNKHGDQSLGMDNQRNNRGNNNNLHLGSEASSTTSIEEERSTTSTRSMTIASRMNSTDSRFHELEQLIKRQQQDSKTSGKISSDRLNNLERQFTRIEELDTKLSAVQTQIEHSNVKLEQSAKEQKILSDNLEVLSKETSYQFSDMNDKILLTMESQHDMSHTMLDMRKQFERLSQFMTTMADKMEIAMTQQHTDGMTNSNTGNLENPRANKRSQHGGGSSVHSGSTKSKTSQDSSQDTSVYRSPEKKKLHTRSKHQTGDDEHDNGIVADKIDKERIKPIEGLAYQEEKGEGFAILGIGGEALEDMSESSDVCLNLEDAFDELQQANTLHQDRGQHHFGNLASQEAPTDLDDQYTSPLDPDGGKPD